MAMDSDQKPYVTELFVRMDCNRCAQRIKRAIERIHGVHNVNIDIQQHKIIVVGQADPEAIKKAIKKTRNMAIVSSHIEQSYSEPQREVVLQTETAMEPANTAEEKVVGEAQMVHDYPYNSNITRGQSNNHPNLTHAAPYYNNHSYNNRSSLPYITEHGYLQPPPPQMTYSNGYNNGYDQNGAAEEEYYRNLQGDGNNMNSMFSDENPNACTIV